MKYSTVCLFLAAFALGVACAPDNDSTPAQTTYNSPWLVDETGMDIAPRITLEPKP